MGCLVRRPRSSGVVVDVARLKRERRTKGESAARVFAAPL
jgi:hypothetical protein